MFTNYFTFYPSSNASSPTEFGLAFESQLTSFIKKIRPYPFQLLPLPNEINEYVLSFLKLSDLTIVAKVNRYSKQLADYVMVKKIKCLGCSDDYLEGSKEYLSLLVQDIIYLKKDPFFSSNIIISNQHSNIINFVLTLNGLRNLSTEKLVDLCSKDCIYNKNLFCIFLSYLLAQADELPLDRDKFQDVKILNKALTYKKFKIFELLLNKGISPVSNNANYTPLHLACQEGNIYLAERLINAGADVNYLTRRMFMPVGFSLPWSDNSAALHIAACKGNIKLMELLLKSGANPNAANENGAALLLNFARNGNSYLKIMELLLNYQADVNFINPKTNYTALNIAAMHGQDKVVELLLKRGAELNYRVNTNGLFTLHMASRGGYLGKDGRHLRNFYTGVYNYLKTVEVLLKYGASVNERNFKGKTPLYIAASNNKGCVKMMELLLENGADPHIYTNKGVLPIYRAAAIGNLQGVKLLLKYGAYV